MSRTATDHHWCDISCYDLLLTPRVRTISSSAGDLEHEGTLSADYRLISDTLNVQGAQAALERCLPG